MLTVSHGVLQTSLSPSNTSENFILLTWLCLGFETATIIYYLLWFQLSDSGIQKELNKVQLSGPL